MQVNKYQSVKSYRFLPLTEDPSGFEGSLCVCVCGGGAGIHEMGVVSCVVFFGGRIEWDSMYCGT